MNDLAKGGRGKKAPYSSTHYRFPVPLKPLVEEMAANYRELVTEYEDPEDPALIAAVIQAIGPGAPGVEAASPTNPQSPMPNAVIQAIAPEVEIAITDINLEKAIVILHYALTLKANAGGAIKERIREALLHLV